MTEVGGRYDRQVRLWGEDGQSSIQEARVLILGSDSVATEILKSLVLAGISSFVVADDHIVREPDLGSNFFLDQHDFGKRRAQAVIEKLTELNPAVAGRAISLEQFESYMLRGGVTVVSVNLPRTLRQSLENSQGKFPIISVSTNGLLGTIAVRHQSHTILNAHEENRKPDLRLFAPFDAIKKIVAENDIEGMSVDRLRHTPYLILYFKALEVFREKRNDPEAFPNTYKDRKEIQDIIQNMRKRDERGSLDSENFEEAKAAVTRSFQKTSIPDGVKHVFEQPECETSTEPFWIFSQALKRFAKQHHDHLPHYGTVPDMFSDTERYTKIATAYFEKSQQDARKVYELVQRIEVERNVSGSLSEETCFAMCKNADQIRFVRGKRSSEKEIIAKILEHIRDAEVEDESKIDCAVWLLLQHAVLRFENEKGRFPGTNGVPCNIDAGDLKERVMAIINESEIEDKEAISKRIPMSAIEEMCRYGDSQLHVISALIGGITAQEIIKIATRQFVPINNTFVYDGISQNSRTFDL